MDTEVLRETFDLAARGTSVAEARHRSLSWLVRHAVAEQATETAELIVSELVTNAVLHSNSTVIGCALHLYSRLLRVEVTDQGAGHSSPVIRCAGTDEMSGRGLLLVSALSEAWGTCPAVPFGWTVWATISTATRDTGPLTQHGHPGRPAKRRGPEVTAHPFGIIRSAVHQHYPVSSPPVPDSG